MWSGFGWQPMLNNWRGRCRSPMRSTMLPAGRCPGPGRSSTPPSGRGRSPPAARLSVEVVGRIPESSHRLHRRAEGRSAVRWYRCQDSPSGTLLGWFLLSFVRVWIERYFLRITTLADSMVSVLAVLLKIFREQTQSSCTTLQVARSAASNWSKLFVFGTRWYIPKFK